MPWKNTEYLVVFCHDHFSKSDNDTNDLIMKIPNETDFQQVVYNVSLDIDFKDLKRLKKT